MGNLGFSNKGGGVGPRYPLPILEVCTVLALHIKGVVWIYAGAMDIKRGGDLERKGGFLRYRGPYPPFSPLALRQSSPSGFYEEPKPNFKT